MPTKKQRANKARCRRQHQSATRSALRDPVPDAITDLKALRREGRVVEVGQSTVPHTRCPAIRVVLNTSDIEAVARGLAVGATTEIFFVLGDRYPRLATGRLC